MMSGSKYEVAGSVDVKLSGVTGAELKIVAEALFQGSQLEYNSRRSRQRS